MGVQRERADDDAEGGGCAVSDEASADERGDPIVGRKTMADGSHLPLRQSEADVIMAQIATDDARRIALMPDEKTAIKMMCDAYHRLKDLGWREAVYCPKDGSSFEVIEPGSTGIFRAHYNGEWPKGSWWVEDSGDLWPSRPVLYRLYPEDEAKWKAKMEAARARYRAESKGAANAEA